MNRSSSIKFNLVPLIQNAAQKRGLIFGSIILCALLGFEIFNYSSTSYALHDILGDLAFGPFQWATVLAVAFCGIDFAGIARIFTPETGRDEPAEVWYLFAAWFLAAGFNSTLTWWGVAVAVRQHSAAGGFLVGHENMVTAVPVFVAAMVLIIRVLLINTFSIAGERIFTLAEARPASYSSRPVYRPSQASMRETNATFPRPAPKPASSNYSQPLYNEPTYHPVGMSAQAREGFNSSARR